MNERVVTLLKLQRTKLLDEQLHNGFHNLLVVFPVDFRDDASRQQRVQYELWLVLLRNTRQTISNDTVETRLDVLSTPHDGVICAIVGKVHGEQKSTFDATALLTIREHHVVHHRAPDLRLTPIRMT